MKIRGRVVLRIKYNQIWAPKFDMRFFEGGYLVYGFLGVLGFLRVS